MARHRLSAVIFGLAVIIGATGCNFDDAEEAARKEIGRFHAMLNDERYEEIYAGLDPKFKEVSTEQEMFEILQAVHIKLGKVTSSTIVQGKTSSFLTETQVVMAVEAEFERGKAVETFTFLYANKKASLVGYNINSRELIIK